MKIIQKQTLDRFYEAATNQDAQVLRSLLTDSFKFKSPVGDFDNPDDYVDHLAGFCGWISGSRYIAENENVVHMFVLHTKTPTGQINIPMCDVFKFDGEQITEQELFADSRLFPTPT